MITPLGFMFVVENPFSLRIGKFDNCPISNKSKKDTLFTLHEKCCSTTPSKSSQAAADKVKAISSNNYSAHDAKRVKRLNLWRGEVHDLSVGLESSF